ncbi:MAG TPA: alpha/beta hydrolase-fold protein [Methylomirabilota bacterium]
MYDAGAGTEFSGDIVGNIRRLADVESRELGNRRDLFVYLPPSYATSGRHYPVIYMQDGQNLFDAALSFAGAWHVDDTMEALAREGLEAIVVGIPNMGAERADEYAPFRDERCGGGRADAYLAFVAGTVKPLVDARFRTRREPAHTGIMGSSMGGLVSLYALLTRPATFGFAGVMSPSLWFADGAIFRVAEAAGRWDGRLYLDTGTGEGRPHVRQVREMVRLLRRQAPHPRRQLRYVEDRGAGHNEAAWGARFERAIRWLLPPRRDLNW